MLQQISVCVSRRFQEFCLNFRRNFPGFSQKFPRNLQEIHADIEARHEAKMAKNAKKE